jgi:hypothetical protein
MKYQFLGMCLFVLSSGYVHAQTDVYVCLDDRGNREYKNTGTTKGCRKVDLPNITTVPAPAKKPIVQASSAKSSSSSPSDFPRVDSGTQKTRDNDRKQILLDEMKTEEQKLAALKKDMGSGEPERRGDEHNYAKYQERVASMKDDINRTEKNIEALQREINNLR